jgi:hypothetical protein
MAGEKNGEGACGCWEKEDGGSQEIICVRQKKSVGRAA